MRSRLCIVCSILALVLLVGCMPASTFHTPYVLQPGESVRGAGFTGFYSFAEGEPWIPALDFYTRRSWGPNSDYGLRFAVPQLIPTVDVKYQVRREPVLIAADLAACLCPFPYPGIIPSLLVGTEQLYGGVKLPLTMMHAGAGVMLGTALGRERNVLLEMNLFYQPAVHPDMRSGMLGTVGAALQSRRQR